MEKTVSKKAVRLKIEIFVEIFNNYNHNQLLLQHICTDYCSIQYNNIIIIDIYDHSNYTEQ